MSDGGIKLKVIIQTPTAPPDPELPIQAVIPPPEFTEFGGGNENGGTYFELNWQTGQAHSRQQSLLTTYYGETSTEPNPYEYNGNSNGNNGNSNGNFSVPNSHGYGKNQIEPNYYDVSSNEQTSFYSSDNSNYLSLDDLINLAADNKNFSEFRDKSPDFWHEVRQISETKIFETGDGIETESVSKYQDLLTEMKSKKLSFDEFAETLPPKEREVFKARHQIDETFGTNIFKSDGVTLNETGQSRVREVAVENGQIATLPPNVRLELREGKAAPVSNDTAVLTRREVTVGNDTPVLTRREIISGVKNAVMFGENIANRPIAEKIESGELKLSDKSAQIAVGTTTNSILAENGAPRVVNNAVLDTSPSVNPVMRRDGGAAMGGALINGSFASVDNFKNSENVEIGSSPFVGNSNFDGGKSFAAGATGVMMSAAIGSLIPGSDAVISGVVGFISGIVVGVEADQGLRWLSGDRPTAIAPTNNVNLLDDNSFAPNLQPVLA